MSQIRADLNLNCEKFLSAIKTVDNAIAHVEHSVVGFAMTFKGLQFAGEAIESQFEKLKQSFELGAKLKDMSINTGQSVSDMVLLRHAFDLAGIGADAVTPALFNLQKSLSGVNENGEATKPVFDKLGVSIQALRSLSAVDQLKMIGEALRGIENPADRAKAAADLFGKAGKNMMALLGNPEIFGEAGKQIGSFGDAMQANAGKFKEAEDAMKDLSLSVQKFFASIAIGSVDALSKSIKHLAHTDFTRLGESIGGVISMAIKLGEILYKFSPILIGMAAAMTANSFAGSTLFASLSAGAYRAKSAAEMYVYTLIKTEGAMARLGVVGSGVFTSLANGIKGLWAALGPIGIGIMLGTYAYQAISGRADKMNNATGAVKTIDTDQAGQIKQNFAVMQTVSSETDRVKAAETMSKQLEDVHEKMRKIDEEFSNDNGFDDAGRARILEAYQNQAKGLELQLRSLDRIPPALILARAAAKRESEALEEARKNAEKLRGEVEKAREAMEGDKKKEAFEELSPEKQKQKVLDDVGEKNAKDIETEISVLDSVIARKEASGQATDAELKKQKELIEARRQLIGIEKAIAREKEQAAEKAEKDKEKADEEKKKKAEQDKKFNEFEHAWQLGVAKTKAEINGDDAGVKRIEHQQRVERYEKQALEAGEDPVKARKMAQARAKEDEDLEEKKKKEKGENSGPAVGHLQRIGGGGTLGVGVADPLLREAQRQTRAIEAQTRAQAETNRLLYANKKAPLKVEVIPRFADA